MDTDTSDVSVSISCAENPAPLIQHDAGICFVCFFIVVFVVMSLIEHKQRMETLAFKQRLYKLRQQFLDDDTNDKKEENDNDDEKEREG